MFSRGKNKPLELSLDGSNYAPAPSPNSLKPQAATGTKHEDRSFDTTSNKSSSTKMLSKEQQLAELYNQKQRPLPKPSNVAPATHNLPVSTQPSNTPTIINNYYYVQPQQEQQQLRPHSDIPINPSAYADQQQFIQQQHRHYQQQQQHQYQQQKQQQQQQQQQRHSHNPYNHSQACSQSSVRHSSGSSFTPAASATAAPRALAPGAQTQRSSSASAMMSSSSTSSLNSTHHHHGHQHQHQHQNHHQRSSRSSSTYLDPEDDKYESFVMRSSGNHKSPKREPPAKLKDSYERNSIYSSASLTKDDLKVMKSSSRSHSSESRSSKRDQIQSNSYYNSETVAKIPNIKFDGDVLDDFSSLSLQKRNQKNLVKELINMDDENINVHNNDFYRDFQDFCVSDDLLSLEQLGSILYDPHNNNNRFKFSSLETIVRTFAPKSPSYDLDFRSFVKMCKFIKGCFISFNYHDKRGNDHLLDFGEFQRALISNKISCPDYLLANIFQTSETIDFEHYILAVIMIRKNEKNH